MYSAVKLSKNADIDKYRYSGYGTGFNRKGRFLFPGGGFGQNVIIFGVDMSFSVHVDNNKKDFNYWKRCNARIRQAFITCWKNVFN